MRYVKLLLGGLLLVVAVLGGVGAFIDPAGTTPDNLPAAVRFGQLLGVLLFGWGGVALIRSGVRQGRKSTPANATPSA